MAVVEFIHRCLDQNHRSLLRCLDGLTVDELTWRPNAQCMSIGFIAWHCGRVMDMWIQGRINGVPQLWEESWADKMGRSPADPTDLGAMFGEKELKEFVVPSLDLLLAYAEDAHKHTMEFLLSTDDDTLEKTVIMLRGSEFSLSTIFQQVIWEFNQHGGQMAYLRGIQRGMEDPTYNGGVLPQASPKVG